MRRKSFQRRPETVVRNIPRATQKHHAAEEEDRIVLDGPRERDLDRGALLGEGVAETCIALDRRIS